MSYDIERMREELDSEFAEWWSVLTEDERQAYWEFILIGAEMRMLGIEEPPLTSEQQEALREERNSLIRSRRGDTGPADQR